LPRHKKNSKTKRRRKTYSLGFADEVGDGGGGFREDGRGVNTVEGDIGGDVEARHFSSLRLLSLLLLTMMSEYSYRTDSVFFLLIRPRIYENIFFLTLSKMPFS